MPGTYGGTTQNLYIKKIIIIDEPDIFAVEDAEYMGHFACTTTTHTCRCRLCRRLLLALLLLSGQRSRVLLDDRLLLLLLQRLLLGLLLGGVVLLLLVLMSLSLGL